MPILTAVCIIRSVEGLEMISPARPSSDERESASGF